jgi:hypothetical protein
LQGVTHLLHLILIQGATHAASKAAATTRLCDNL